MAAVPHSGCAPMRNITVTVPDDVYRNARIAAAQLGTSVSALVAGYLEQLARSDDRFQRLLSLQEQTWAEIDASGTGYRASERLSREELHDRAALR